MTPEEYDGTPPGTATRTFIKFMMSTMMLALGSEVGGGITNALSDGLKKLAEMQLATNPDDKTLADVVDTLDKDHQAAMRKGLLIIGAWSAFEAWAEDFTKGLMQTNRDLFEGKAFRRMQVSPGHLRTESGRDIVWEAIEGSLDRDQQGIARYEELFTSVGLPGDVLDGSEVDIRSPFLNAFAIRNVWAHNAGYADQKFVERSSGLLDFAVGDLVSLKYDEQFQLCVSALIMYPMIVSNRQREANGIGPQPLHGRPRDTPLGQAYLAQYPGA